MSSSELPDAAVAWYLRKSFWTFAVGSVGIVGSSFSFALDGSVWAKAMFCSLTGIMGLAQIWALASRVTTEAVKTRSALVTGTGDGAVPAGQRPAPTETK